MESNTSPWQKPSTNLTYVIEKGADVLPYERIGKFIDNCVFLQEVITATLIKLSSLKREIDDMAKINKPHHLMVLLEELDVTMVENETTMSQILKVFDGY